MNRNERRTDDLPEAVGDQGVSTGSLTAAEWNRKSLDAWEANARHWDTYMREGNSFVEHLIVPAEHHLLSVQAGDRILDVACGNGLHSRRLARRGALVTAFDSSPTMIECARSRTAPAEAIDYRVLDATKLADFAELERASFDGAICHMALFNFAAIEPLFTAMRFLLKAKAPAIFSSGHPCFNSAPVTLMAETTDDGGTIFTRYGVKVTDYLTPSVTYQRAVPDCPQAHPIYHRPLQQVIAAATAAGFVLDGLLEPSFPPTGLSSSRAPSWDSRFSEIPPVIVFRFRALEA